MTSLQMTRRQLMGLAALAAATPAANKKRAPQPGAATEDLVWPLPPDPPRVRWIAQYSDLTSLRGGPPKQRWVDRVAGSKSAKEKLAIQKPYGITVDSKGRIYVADAQQRTVFILSPESGQVDHRSGTSRAPLALPIGVAVDARDRLFVSDAALHSVLCYGPNGEMLGQFGTTELERPGAIAVDRNANRLYVPDAKGNRIAVFNTETLRFERYLGSASTPGKAEPGRFAAPTNVAVDRNGNLYVTDTWNCRVQVFNSSGKFVRAFGKQGTGPGQFTRPKGIGVDSQGHVYVADSEFNNFQILTPEGRPLLAIGSLGQERGQFVLLAGLYIDSEDKIYTTEQVNGRVQVFRYLPQQVAGGGKEGLRLASQ